MNPSYTRTLLFLTFLLLLMYWLYPFGTKNVLTSIIYLNNDTEGRVLLRPPLTIGDMFLVVSSEEYKEGACVVFSDACIGRVGRVFNGSAEVFLFSSPSLSEEFSVGSYIGKSEGLGSGSFRILVPPVEEDIVLGEDVVHQRTGDIVGSVSHIQKISDNTPEVYLLVSLNENIFEIDRVSVRDALPEIDRETEEEISGESEEVEEEETEEAEEEETETEEAETEEESEDGEESVLMHENHITYQ